MAAAPSQDAQLDRLWQLSEEYGLSIQVPPSPKPKPEQPPSYRTHDDVFLAEELLKKQRVSESQNVPFKGGLSRAFTAKKASWEYKEIYEALVGHITDQGSPGVAEALITKLNALGGNLNLVQKSRTSLLSRRRSLDLSERSKILQIAVKNRQLEMVEVLLPFADALALDTSLPMAMRNRDDAIVELLIRYGASASQTADGQDAFRQACAVGGQPGLIAMIMGSEGRPPAPWVSQSMVEAARAGCLDTVIHLSQSIADGNHDAAAALKAAIGLGRRDIILALLLSNRPPQQPGINEAFEQLMRHQNINPNEKMAIAEALLCAGAEGIPVAQALVHASAISFLEMKSGLQRQDRSHCVELLSKDIRFEDRQYLLTAFLKEGAMGAPLDEALIDSAEVGDVGAVKILLAPSTQIDEIPLGQNANKPVQPTKPRRWETASTDYKGALALQVAVQKGNIAIADLILTHKPPSHVALAQVYPSTRNLPKPDRYRLTELFLRAGLSGPCMHSALENAINEQSPGRDENLISLLLRHHADVNFNEGHVITAAIAQNDVKLLEMLLNGKPTEKTIARAIPRAIQVTDSSLRLQMTTMLLGSGAIKGTNEVSIALDSAIVTKPTDKRLIRALLQQGNANVNINQGSIVEHAAQDPDPEILHLILGIGQPNDESIDRALKSLGKLPASSAKTNNLTALLNRTKSKGAMSDLLVDEVKILTKAPPSERNFASLKSLLVSGADVNASNGEALGCAVSASSMQIVEILMTASPSPMTLAWVMPCALRIRDPMDRLTYAQKLLDHGMPPSEVNRALVFAVQTHPNDIPLINSLLIHADTSDGLALAEAIKNENKDIVELILGKKSFTANVLDARFAEALKIKNQALRTLLCNCLLAAGVSGEVISDALLAAASDGDLEFGMILVKNGGSIEHKDGQAIVEACKAGAVGVLEMLLAGNMKVSPKTLQKGFQGATQVGNLKKRAEIFRLLLQRGVSGEVVDIQLVSAVRYGDEGKDIVRLLLDSGASPDYSNGEAVEKAVRSAFLGSLELLLGIAEVGENGRGQQKKPSSSTLVRGLDACWDLSRDTRFTVIDWLFRAGKLVPSAVHSALHRAVNEEEPEERLIHLLINHRASPVVNNCQTLIDATSNLPAELFEELLGSRVASEDASLVFGRAFRFGDSSSWASERGLKIATSLLAKGAKGDGVGSALVAVLKQHITAPQSVTHSFVDLLLKNGADVNFNHGEALQLAAAHGNSKLLARLLAEKPSVETLTLAFPTIFDAPVTEDEAHELITLFTEYRDGNSQLDVMFEYPDSGPVVIRALSQYPRSTKILEALLDTGFYHDQMTTFRAINGFEEEEPVSLLMWALLQPQKKISTGIINLLVERGSKVNFETATSHVTPLMVAIRERRQDVARLLLLAGADVDVTDALGNSPLSMASAIGGDLAVAMMSNLLAAGASKNDGSLHNAARELNVQAMQVLVEYRHDPDFPSPLHNGRSALAELCLHATDSIQMTLSKEKAMERAIEFLLQSGTDITIQSEGKSILLLAMESADPLATTRVLLRTGLWKDINKPFNQYSDGKYTFSPSMYAERVLPDSDKKTELLRLLQSNRCIKVYYANSGPQPDDAVGLPSHIQREEEERRARLESIRMDNEQHSLAIQRSKDLAAVQAEIWASQAEFEEARKKRAHNTDILALQERARAEESIFNSALRQQRAKQNADLQHQEDLTKASVTRARAIGDAELAIEGQKQTRLLEWERNIGNERVGNANQISSIRLREREEMERFDKAADARFTTRLKEQKKLVDSQSTLAANLNSAAPGARRQIGYVSSELGPD
ncbi:putative ankyrin repeat containing protein [Rosellinia necatrix]|uniref:Putative ankyrin repeat containing protein n=1 Tax=Rosellinia necatrix TaxID=77044 RepID=A0A1W2TAW5_ROSNE|nr:putative ankyrin repeat containing protein [Rosellinia necatrix]